MFQPETSPFSLVLGLREVFRACDPQFPLPGLITGGVAAGVPAAVLGASRKLRSICLKHKTGGSQFISAGIVAGAAVGGALDLGELAYTRLSTWNRGNRKSWRDYLLTIRHQKQKGFEAKQKEQDIEREYAEFVRKLVLRDMDEAEKGKAPVPQSEDLFVGKKESSAR